MYSPLHFSVIDGFVSFWMGNRRSRDKKFILKTFPNLSLITLAPAKSNGKIDNSYSVLWRVLELSFSEFSWNFSYISKLNIFICSDFGFSFQLVSNYGIHSISWNEKKHKIILFITYLFTVICVGRTNCGTQIWKIYWNELSWPVIKKV